MTEPMTSGMMTQAEMDEIRQAADAATPGPWEKIVNANTVYSDSARLVVSAEARSEDTKFIALSRTAIPRLLAHIDSLTAALSEKTKEAEAKEHTLVSAEYGGICFVCKHKGDCAIESDVMHSCSFIRKGPKHLADAIIPAGIGTLPEVGK